MLLSQNGLVANDRAFIRSATIAGTDVKVAVRIGPVGDLLLYAAARWHREVEPLRAPDGVLDCWGYAERLIRGSATDLSNHASGSALDFRARAHPLGTAPSATYSAAQIAAIHRIVGDCQGALRWGGDYTGRKDSMHLEVNTTEARCAVVLAQLNGRATPGPTPSPTPRTPPPVKDDDLMMPIQIDAYSDGSFRAAAPCEAGSSSSVIAQAWVVFGVTWGSADCLISFLGDDGLVLGAAGQKRGQVTNNRRLVADVPDGAVMVTLEGKATAGAITAASVITKAKA